MTNIGDSLFSGGARTEVDAGGFSNGGLGFGPIGRIYIYDIVPLALNATALAASQSPGSAAITLAAGTGVTAVVDAYGVTRYTLDVPRAVTVTSGGNDTGIAFLIKGYDVYNAPMSQLLTGASGAAATTTKAFKSIVSVVPNGAVASTVTVGTADVFGLPVAVINATYIITAKWDSALATNAGTFVAADNTSPATTTTGDVRGTFAQSGNPSNGVRRLVISVALSEIQSGVKQTVIGVLGQPQV